MREVTGSSPVVSTTNSTQVGAFFVVERIDRKRVCSHRFTRGANGELLKKSETLLSDDALPPRAVDTCCLHHKKKGYRKVSLLFFATIIQQGLRVGAASESEHFA